MERQSGGEVTSRRYDPEIAHIFLLTAYAGHRELRGWAADPEVMEQRARRGELFVVFWWAFYGMTLVVANHMAAYRVPEGLLSLCLQVTTIFFGTLTSQQLHRRRRTRTEGIPEDGPTLEHQVWGIIRQSREPVRPAMLEEMLDVSRSSVYRITRRLREAGRIEWTGRNENDPEGGFRAKSVKN